jgi:electron transport complex protein RnfE
MILSRQEAFASKRPLGRSLLDAAGTGFGFIIALLMMGGVRELLGNGTLLGVNVLGANYEPWVVMVLPPGGFLTLGFLLLGLSWIEKKKAARAAVREWPDGVGQERKAA